MVTHLKVTHLKVTHPTHNPSPKEHQSPGQHAKHGAGLDSRSEPFDKAHRSASPRDRQKQRLGPPALTWV